MLTGWKSVQMPTRAMTIPSHCTQAGRSFRRTPLIRATTIGSNAKRSRVVTVGRWNKATNCTPAPIEYKSRPRAPRVIHDFRLILCRVRRFDLDRAKGTKLRKAKKYLKPAKVRGGMSSSPCLISTQEDDHRVTTSRAARMATGLEADSVLIMHRSSSPGSVPPARWRWRRAQPTEEARAGRPG